MGIPYSREINAAFEEVTPLVAAGFQVLKTTKNIGILLAVIQVLTVLFLMLILFVLLGILYSVNPDLERERIEIVTPFFRRLAHATFWGMVEGLVAMIVGFGGFVVMGMLLVKRWKPDALEIAAEEDAEMALEGEKEEKEKDDGKKKGKKGKKGKKEEKEEKEEGKDEGKKK